MPPGARNPLRTCTRGVGELIRAALDGGAQRLTPPRISSHGMLTAPGVGRRTAAVRPTQALG
ncbi:hypothetical protein J8J14_17120 [Roseomonas sp. SSH11]|uniref:Uncharacterized protein n=1 Tax=Pararoseomonas baculiformis TaxID=2820812 RepID=A0ABS4AJW0_9PROT|nr:hypothetical protein [Pararoseomonas baculiformis]